MKQALLIIDVQRALFDSKPPPFESAAVIARINALAARARDAQVPVVFIQHEDGGALAFGSDGWQLDGALTVRPGDFAVRKTTADSFLKTDLGDVLAAKDVDCVVVAGYASEFCVDTTVRRAAALGYEVVIAADAHTTHDKAHATGGLIRAHHNATLADISSFGPRISAVPAEQLVFGA